MPSQTRTRTIALPLTLLALALSSLLTGCGVGSTGGAGMSAPSPTFRTIGGIVHGGNQPVTGATVTLWAAGTTGTTAASYGANAISIATTTTNSTGSFAFNNPITGASPCTTGQYLYITSVGGNTGAGINSTAAFMAALPTPCGTTTAAQTVFVNEVTTVASVFALQQFLSITPGGSPAWTIGAPSANTVGLANAFLTVGTMVNIATGTSSATSVTSTVNATQYTTAVLPDFKKINTVANLLAACINTTGGSMCSSLFADVTPGTAAAPTDTIQAAYYLATNPAGLTMNAHGNAQGSPYYLCNQYISGTPPFQPALTCTTASYPTDWMVGVSFTTTNPSAATVATLQPGSIAIDGSGNIWTNADNNSVTGGSIAALNVAGQVVVAPVTSTTISTTAGWDGSGYTGSTTYTLGGAKAYSLAIDTNNNAWAGTFYGPTVSNVGNTAASTTGTYQMPVVQVTPLGASTGYLVGQQVNAISIDGSNNIYLGDNTTVGPGGGSARYYVSELVAAGSPAYSTFYTGIGRGTGYYAATAIDQSANQYVLPFYNTCSGTINRTDTAIMAQQTVNSAANTGVSTITLSTTAPTTCAFTGAVDASNNVWGTAGTYLEYINVSSSLTAPTITSFASGTGTTYGGLDSPSGLAVDGVGNLWVANGPSSATGGVSEFVPGSNGTTITALSPAGSSVYGFGSTYAYQKAIGTVIDPSGNVWIETSGGNLLNFLVGAAAPVITPISQQIKLGAIGIRPQTIGTSTAPLAVLSSTSLTFASTPENSLSASQLVTLSNSGSAALAISSIAFSGTGAADFTESNNCPLTLSPGAYCTLTVTFAPVTPGPLSATLNVNDNATGTPQTISVSGTATAPVPGSLSLTSTSLTFTQAAQSTSAAQLVTLNNTGSNVLAISSIGLTGTYAANYAQTNTCGTSVAVGGSCTISVTFNPYLAMTGQTAAVSIVSSATTSPNTISLTGTGTGTLSINTSNATGWTISTGAINLTWNSQTGNLVSVMLAGTTDQLVDTTTTSSNGQPDGLYMDNTGLGSATPTATYTQVGNEYIDWSITYPSNSTNAYTWSEHFVVTANDPGLHVYFVAKHASTDIAGALGQIQYVFRINQSIFTNTYSYNSGLNNLGATEIALPSIAEMSSSDPGRAVQNAAEDLHGFSLPSGFGREFMTKYDYSSYEYLHQEHGLYGTTYGAWTILPSTETLSGGPTKQDLIFTENILMMEAFSDHLDNPLSLNTAAGVANQRLFGPFTFEFNKFTTNNSTPASLFTEAQQYLPYFHELYDNETTLLANGYTASTARGTVAPTISGGGSSTPNTAWTILGDTGVNYQVSSSGYQYWTSNNATGTATLTGVIPGTYRLSHYVLGQWGELRTDNVVVTANQTTSLPLLKFTPENFSNYTPVWTIGTPDRSAHEFLHGTNTTGSSGSCLNCDDREFWGNWNYWADFAANKGMQVYYATAVGSTPASPLTALNMNLYGQFDPGLYAGIYNSADDTTDGYQYIIPSYVATLSGASGTNGVTTNTPGATIHFTTTSAQQAQGSYAVLSLGIAAAEASVTATLNGHTTTWHYSNASDANIRSGLSGYYEWGALEWPTSDLTTPGSDNILTLTVSQPNGVMIDAMRFEIGGTANPSVTGWHDYGWASGNTFDYQVDTTPNN